MLKHGERIRRRHHHGARIRENAAADLRLIREAMDHSSRFTDVPGAGMVAVGCTALVAAILASGTNTDAAWLAVWGVELAVAALVGGAAVVLKARQNGTEVLSTPIRRYLRGMLPPFATGGILAAFFAEAGLVEHLPGMLLLLYGTALVTGGVHSLGLIRIQGLCFVALGAMTLFVRTEAGDAAMALGFGGLHIVFGAVIARRYGG